MNRMVPTLQLNNDQVGGEALVVGGDTPEEALQPPLLVEYWHTVNRWKWVIIACLIGSLLLGLAFTLLTTPQFTATGRLQIDREEMRVTNVESLRPESVGRDNEFYETQYSLLRARSLAERVARDLRLASDEEFLTIFPVGSEDSEGPSQIATAGERAERQDRIVSALLNNVTISPIRDSRLVDVAFTSPSAELSARISNAWMQAFAAQSVDRRFDSTADARSFLEGRLQELRARLERSETEFVEYARANEIVALSSTTDQEGRTRAERTLIGDSLAALNAELAKATATRIAAQAALSTSRSDQNFNPTIGALRQERAQAAAQHAQLLVQFDPAYPAARQVEEQIAALDESIAREEQRVRRDLSDAYAAASSQEAALRGRVGQLQADLSGQQSAGIRYNILQREVDTNRQLYDALLQRYKEIGVAGVGVSNISIVDQAEIPDSPSSPRLIINLLGALVLGVALSAVTVYVLEQSDEGIKEPSQVVSRLNIPLLGSVPKIDDLPQDQITDPKSDYFEAFVTIRTSLSFSTDHGIPRSFVISSTRPAEGKSTSSLALAVVIARLGRKVALIDGDMRSPSIASLLSIPETGGLSNYLSGSADLPELIRDTPFESLKVLTTGPMPPSATDLLAGDRLVSLVNRLTNEFGFDHVIIDAPPVLAMADVPLIAQSAEGCIFVIQSEETAIRGITNAINRIRAADVPIIGAILTKINVRTAGYGYGYGARYGYGYGYGYEETVKDDGETGNGRA